MDYYKTRSMALSIIAAVSCRHFQQCFPVLLKIFQQQSDLTLAQAEQLCQAPLGQGICHTAASLFAAAAPVAFALLAVAALLAVCRVLGGVHFPRDVIAGALVGVAVGGFVVAVARGQVDGRFSKGSFGSIRV